MQASRAYLATRACSSTGAPDSTAAGTTSPGSLPSITRLGIGENALQKNISLFVIVALHVVGPTKSHDQPVPENLAGDRPFLRQNSLV